MFWLDVAFGAFILAIVLAIVTIIASGWRSE
jgi:hypothetical protein